MRPVFVNSILRSLQAEGRLSSAHSVLAVCSGLAEHALFQSCGVVQVTLSGLDPSVTPERVAPFAVERADARKLPFKDGSFDYVFVSDGLHHCDSPHRALLEMYRVARAGVIVVESRDSAVQRLAERLMWPRQTYELAAVEGNGGTCGGVNYTSVPNFVYRWTEREFEKTISCYDPTGAPGFRYYYGFNPPNRSYSGVMHYAYRITLWAASVVARVFKRQSNSFCMIAFKPTELFPWLIRDAEGRPVFKMKG